MSNLAGQIALQVCLGSYAFAIFIQSNGDIKQEKDSQHKFRRSQSIKIDTDISIDKSV